MRWLIVVLPVLSAACTVLAPGEHLDGELRGDPRLDASDATVRVVTWNIESIGSPGSTEYDAALQVLDRLDADVVLLQEIQWFDDDHNIAPFAADAGYPHVLDGWPVSFGTDTQLILSRYPFNWTDLVDADDLVPGANDFTRATPVAGIDLGGVELVVASGHLKSGREDDAEFRRVVDAHRTVQALGPFDPDTDLVLFGGDVNDDLLDADDTPSTWTYAPWGLPSSYELGSDIAALMDGRGLPNDAFTPFEDAGLVILDARQLSGTDATRPASFRRLDYLIVSPALADGATTEVYETQDEGRSGGLPKSGPVPFLDTEDAADHLPVVADFVLPKADGPTEPTEPTGDALPVAELGSGALLVTEVMANPDACSDDVGEWVELANATTVDVDLSGLELCDGSGCSAVAFTDRSVVPAGGVVVLARSLEACGVDVFGTFTAALSNGGDEVALVGSVPLDVVDYPDADPGRSWVFDPVRCEGTDQGTPGVALACDGEPLFGDGEPVGEAWTLDDVPADVLQISEVMPNPDACSDDVGEWVEIRNTGDRAVDLTGLRLGDALSDGDVGATRLLGAGERAILARSDEACVPTVDGTFAAALSNGGDDVVLLRPDGEILDTMSYPDGDAGVSWVRDGGGWCEAVEATPGAEDAACR